MDILNNKEIGKFLAKARKTAKLSQGEIAALLKVDKRSISAYEHGVRRIHASAFLKLAKILNVSLDDLINQQFTKIDGRTQHAKAIKDLEALPEDEQKIIVNMINSLKNKYTPQK